MKAVVAAINQEKALVGAFSVITNLRMELFEALLPADHGQLELLQHCRVSPALAVRVRVRVGAADKAPALQRQRKVKWQKNIAKKRFIIYDLPTIPEQQPLCPEHYEWI